MCNRNLSNNKITDIEEGAFDGASGVNELLLTSNRLESVQHKMFKGLESLKTLYVYLFGWFYSSFLIGIFENIVSVLKFFWRISCGFFKYILVFLPILLEAIHYINLLFINYGYNESSKAVKQLRMSKHPTSEMEMGIIIKVTEFCTGITYFT